MPFDGLVYENPIMVIWRKMTARLSRPEGWMKKSYWGGPALDGAVCLMGALYDADGRDLESASYNTRDALSDEASVILRAMSAEARHRGFARVERYNDSPTRRFHHIRAFLAAVEKRVIAKVQETADSR
jgi:hypothetical protein